MEVLLGGSRIQYSLEESKKLRKDLTADYFDSPTFQGESLPSFFVFQHVIVMIFLFSLLGPFASLRRFLLSFAGSSLTWEGSPRFGAGLIKICLLI